MILKHIVEMIHEKVVMKGQPLAKCDDKAYIDISSQFSDILNFLSELL